MPCLVAVALLEGAPMHFAPPSFSSERTLKPAPASTRHNDFSRPPTPPPMLWCRATPCQSGLHCRIAVLLASQRVGLQSPPIASPSFSFGKSWLPTPASWQHNDLLFRPQTWSPVHISGVQVQKQDGRFPLAKKYEDPNSFGCAFVQSVGSASDCLVLGRYASLF